MGIGNATRKQVKRDERKANYVRKVQLLSKLYTDLSELSQSLDLTSRNRLTASVIPAKKLTEILQYIPVTLKHGYSLIATIKTQESAHFYATL
jgi:hypothetical protein